MKVCSVPRLDSQQIIKKIPMATTEVTPAVTQLLEAKSRILLENVDIQLLPKPPRQKSCAGNHPGSDRLFMNSVKSGLAC